MSLDSQIEAILFFKGEPVSVKRLSQIIKKEETEIMGALESLAGKLAGRGLVLMRKEDEVMLGTAPSFSPLIEELTKEELAGDLGKAGLETLSIILYRGPINRREIDYIRGVNSSFILRNLLIRGLIEKNVSPHDERSFLYKPTFELLQCMGMTNIEELPEYREMKEALEKVETESKEELSENL